MGAWNSATACSSFSSHHKKVQHECVDFFHKFKVYLGETTHNFRWKGWLSAICLNAFNIPGTGIKSHWTYRPNSTLDITTYISMLDQLLFLNLLSLNEHCLVPCFTYLQTVFEMSCHLFSCIQISSFTILWITFNYKMFVEYIAWISLKEWSLLLRFL